VPGGVIFLLIAFLLLGESGSSKFERGGAPELVLGFVALIVAVILLSPLCLQTLARLAWRAPIAVRLALRDLARYRARSGSALGAISLGVMIAVVICVAAAARYANVLDYAGPNLASNQLIVHTRNGPYGPGGPGADDSSGAGTPSDLQSMAAHALGAVLGTVAGYVAAIAWFRNSSLNGGLFALSSVPAQNLLLIILVGMPLIAAAVGWLLAGREPPAIAHQPIE
jgi:hypothetical protein